MLHRSVPILLTTLMLIGILMPHAAMAAPVYLSCYTVTLSQDHSRQNFTVTWESDLGQISHLFDSGKGFRVPALVSPYTLSYEAVHGNEDLKLTRHYEINRPTLDILVTETLSSPRYQHRIPPSISKAEGRCTLMPTPKTQF